jgi:hypothetical protein
MVRTIITHRDIGDNLLEDSLSLYELLVLAALCLLELSLELLDLAPCEKLCIVSRGGHCGRARRGGENRLSFYLDRSHLGRVTSDHGDDNDEGDSTTTMSSDAVLGTYARSARVWFPDKEQGWISAEVTQASRGAGDKVRLQFIDERGKVHGFDALAFWIIFYSPSVAPANR